MPTAAHMRADRELARRTAGDTSQHAAPTLALSNTTALPPHEGRRTILCSVDPVDAGGRWWLPESPERITPGALRISESGEIQLTLIGQMSSPLSRAERTDKEDGTVVYRATGNLRSVSYPRVLGRVGQDIYTLETGLQTHHNWSLLPQNIDPSETINFTRAFKHVHFEPGEPLLFDRVRVGLQWLTEWVAQPPFQETVTIPTQQKKPSSFVIEATPGLTQLVRLGGGLTEMMSHALSFEGDSINRRGLGSTYYLEVRSKKLVPLDDLMRTQAHLQALVSIGTGRTAGFERVWLSLRLTGPRGGRGTGPRVPAEYIAQWTARDAGIRPLQGLPFTLPDLGGLSAVGRWMSVADKYDEQLSRVVGTRYHRTTVTDDLLNRVAALEGMHKAWRGTYIPLPTRKRREFYLKERLAECATQAGEPFASLVGDVPKWITIAVEERNTIGHGSGAGGYEDKHRLFIADAAYWLFVTCLLRQAQVHERAFTSIAANREFQRLRSNLVEALAAR